MAKLIYALQQQQQKKKKKKKKRVNLCTPFVMTNAH